MWLYWFAKIAWWLPNLILFPTKFFNKQKLPKGKCIVISNHLSGWDPIVMIANMSRPVSFMAKKELYDNWFLNFIFPILKLVKAKRDGKDFQAIREALSLLEQGYAFGLFPEGTRNYKDPAHIQSFKNGAALFALKSKAPVYPLIINRKMRPFKKNYIYMGNPIDLSEYYDKGVNAEMLDKVTEKLWSSMDVMQDNFNKMLSEKYPKKFTYVSRDESISKEVKYKSETNEY